MKLRKTERQIHDPATNNPALEEYARYSPIITRSVTLTERALVILPEMYALQHEIFAAASIAYRWLSWNNAFAKESRLSDPALHAKFLARSGILHLAKTFRAHAHLRRESARQISDLVDYTDPRFTAAKPIHPNRTFTIAYSPRRAGTPAKHFFDRHPGIPSCPIVGISKDQVRDALSRAGHNPATTECHARRRV